MNSLWVRDYFRSKTHGKKHIQLHRRFLLHVFTSLLLSILIYLSLVWSGDKLAAVWHPSAELVKQHEQSLRNSLTDFIEFNQIGADDSWRFHNWLNGESSVKLIVQRRGDILFSSFEPSEQISLVIPPAVDPESAAERTFEVLLTDGPAVATVYYLYQDETATVFRYIAAFAASSVLLILTTLWLKRQAERVRKLTSAVELFSVQNYVKTPEFSGRDEIAALGSSLERYRLNRLHRMNLDEQARVENEKLIRNMAHDLRTPLTALIGYLEILEQEISFEETRQRNFLASAKDKASQLRSMTNNVFEHFFIRSNEIRDDLVLMDGQVYQAQITDLIDSDLEALGFKLETDLTSEPFSVRIDIGMIDRVLNNLMTNISNYGDTANPCRLRTSILRPESVAAGFGGGEEAGDLRSEYFCLMLCNSKNRRSVQGSGAGIGLANVEKIMEAHRGYLRITQTRRSFCVRLIFPLIEPGIEIAPLPD